jgi:hypothetical protein
MFFTYGTLNVRLLNSKCFGHADQNNDSVSDAADVLALAAGIFTYVGGLFDSQFV